jgi:hypothetical protein
MGSHADDYITSVVLIEPDYDTDELDQLRRDFIRRRSRFIQPSTVNYIARDKLKRTLSAESHPSVILRRSLTRLILDLESLLRFLFSLREAHTSWLFYQLTA